MQSDDRLAKLAEMLKDERDELPKDDATPAQSVKLEASGKHISQIGTQVNINSSAPADLLSPEQRRRLNRLVTEISSEYQADPRTLWKEVVHTRTGVSSIEDIPRDKFAEAEQALLDYAELLHAQAHAKRLVAEVLEVANQRGVYQEMTRFCSREFGSAVLNKLNPEQLKAALRYVESHGAQPPSTAVGWTAQMIQLWKRYPSHLVVLIIVSAIAGRIFI